MKVLTLTQPWATLVAIGAKQIETRSWSTTYRGPLAIHAAKGFPTEAMVACYEEPFRTVLIAAGIRTPDDLPKGCVLAVAHLHAIGRIGRRQDGAIIVATQELPVTEQEAAFGDYTPGRFGWRLTNVRALPEPIPARGALGLWEWSAPSEVAA